MILLKLFAILNLVYFGTGLKCYTCGGLTLEECVQKSKKCPPEKNRCLSFMLEGGNSGKIYYKRCGKVKECYGYKLQGTCDSKSSIHGSSFCRPACCETDSCNHSNRAFLSWLAMIPAIAFFLKVIFS